MNPSLLLSIPAFSLGRFGPLVSHLVFWAGLSFALFTGGMGLGKLYGKTLSGLIASRGMWWSKFVAFVSIRLSRKTAMTNEQGKTIVERLKAYRDHDDNRMHGIARLWTILCLILIVAITTSGWIRPFWYPVEHRENVYVFNETRGMDQSWGIWTKQYGWERFDCCPDFPCNRVIWAGWVADEVRYQERGACKSIRAEGLGWWWHKNGSARRIQ